MRKGIEVLKGIYESGGKTYIASKLFKTRQQVTYTKKVPLGWTDYPNKDSTYDIDFKTTKRILVLGQSGSGKSWLTRATAVNRAYLAGLSPVIMTDLGPEYFTSRFPLQPEFSNFKLDYEKSTPFPIKTYYPYFLYKFVGLELPEQILFQYNLDKINPSDITAFINFEQLGLSARLEVEDLVSILMRGKKKFNSIDELVGFINTKRMSLQTKSTLIKSFNNLKNLGVFGNQYQNFDIISDINNGLIPDLNLFGWQRLDFKRYVAMYIALILRELLSARQLNKLDKHLLLIFEELHEFAPRRPRNKAQEITKSEIRTSVFTGRKEKISFWFVTQSPESIDPAIIEQCDLILIPHGFDRSKLMTLVKEILPSYYDYPYEFGMRMANYLSALRKYKDGMREWLVLERGGEITKIAPLGPLSRHKTEGEVY